MTTQENSSQITITVEQAASFFKQQLLDIIDDKATFDALKGNLKDALRESDLWGAGTLTFVGQAETKRLLEKQFDDPQTAAYIKQILFKDQDEISLNELQTNFDACCRGEGLDNISEDAKYVMAAAKAGQKTVPHRFNFPHPSNLAALEDAGVAVVKTRSVLPKPQGFPVTRQPDRDETGKESDETHGLNWPEPLGGNEKQSDAQDADTPPTPQPQPKQTTSRDETDAEVEEDEIAVTDRRHLRRQLRESAEEFRQSLRRNEPAFEEDFAELEAEMDAFYEALRNTHAEGHDVSRRHPTAEDKERRQEIRQERRDFERGTDEHWELNREFNRTGHALEGLKNLRDDLMLQLRESKRDSADLRGPIALEGYLDPDRRELRQERRELRENLRETRHALREARHALRHQDIYLNDSNNLEPLETAKEKLQELQELYAENGLQRQEKRLLKDLGKDLKRMGKMDDVGEAMRDFNLRVSNLVDARTPDNGRDKG